MIAQATTILEQQEKAWDQFSPGWKKWDDFTMQFLDKQGQRIVAHLDPSPEAHILDIATGTGEPGLTLARRAHRGMVTAVDLSEGMLSVAKEKATALNIDNFSTIAADACNLPFGDESFDMISCRLGFMFFPDMDQAAMEMARVLKPGGKIAVTVWDGPDGNPWVMNMMKVLKGKLDMPAPPPEAPGLFRCASPGMISGLFREVGFNNIQESEIPGIMTCRSAQEYWAFMNDVVPPVVSALAKADPVIRQEIRDEIFHALNNEKSNRPIEVSCQARLIVAEKI